MKMLLKLIDVIGVFCILMQIGWLVYSFTDYKPAGTIAFFSAAILLSLGFCGKSLDHIGYFTIKRW